MFLGSLFVPFLGMVFPETIIPSETRTILLIVGTMTVLAMFPAWIQLGFRDTMTVIGCSVAYVPSLVKLTTTYLETGESATRFPIMLIMILIHITIGWSSLRDTKTIITFVWTAVLLNNAFLLIHPPFQTLFLAPVLFLGAFATTSFASRYRTTVA